ncbi:hypothetical protein [Roseimaritima sediminicola]|uniref:hypothetical protein n=1 Tax=Roseimaritima sediminicola TaxID=2662066 RepID=UPI0012982A80|nr:hypothetical protein [Roseimaritima sediminicola]
MARLFAVLTLLLCCSPLVAQQDLEIFDGNYPVSFFFRYPEGLAAKGKMPFEAWDARFSQLSGVMGKMLDEEILGRSASQDYFRRFKQRHPRQAVLLHVNGGFRNPLADIRHYDDGHWLYYNGTSVLDAISAEPEQITVRVADTRFFQLRPHRNNPSLPDDVGICALDEHGRPDWSVAEQTRLVAIDAQRSTITLERSLYGDKQRHAFPAGQAYVAAHVAQNWGTDNRLWALNLSTTCPRNERGQRAIEVWANELIHAIQPDGELDFVDGVQFDVPFVDPVSLGRHRTPDADADGKADLGIVAGEPVMVAGFEDLFRRLRDALPDQLILADAMGKSQRCLAHLNGMEIEGFPDLTDADFSRWAAATNYLRFWSTRSRPPRLTYGLMKFLRWPRKPTAADARLIMAGTTLFDAAVPIGRVPDQPVGSVYDELLGGTLQQKGWLGKPTSPARRLGLETANLASQGWQSKVASLDATPRGTTWRAESLAAQAISFELGYEQRQKCDLMLRMTVSAERRNRYPQPSYRELTIHLESDVPLPESLSQTEFSTPVDGEPFEAIFYFRDVPAGTLRFRCEVEGQEAVTVYEHSLHQAADLVVREFEQGVVLANPSNRSAAFDLASLFPNQILRRLEATKRQDQSVNNGEPVGRVVRVEARDALFLLKK